MLSGGHYSFAVLVSILRHNIDLRLSYTAIVMNTELVVGEGRFLHGKRESTGCLAFTLAKGPVPCNGC